MEDDHEIGHVHMPSPTAWPFVLALGIALLAAGMVTNIAVSALGLLLSLGAVVGWFSRRTARRSPRDGRGARRTPQELQLRAPRLSACRSGRCTGR